MEDNNGGKVVGRRRTLAMLGVGLAAAGSAFVLGCNNSSSGGGGGGSGDNTVKPGANSCDSQIDENSANLRKTLQYHDRATDPAKNCGSCAQFVEGQYGTCGGCKVIPGPVRSKGGCLSFAPKEGGAATPT